MSIAQRNNLTLAPSGATCAGKHGAPIGALMFMKAEAINMLLLRSKDCGTRRARSLGPHGPKLLRK